MSDPPLNDGQKTASAVSSGLGVLLFVSVTFGLAFGIYETLLPLYWEWAGMPRAVMGIIFSIAAAGVFVLRVYVGWLSDIFGRKLFYTASLGVSCMAQFGTPLLPGWLMQSLLKTLRDASVLVRDAMHSVLLYERGSKEFMGSLGLTRGAELSCNGLGCLIGGLLIWASASAALQPNFRVPFLFSAGLVLIAAIAFGAFFKATPSPPHETSGRGSLRSLFSADLPPKLWLLVVFGFVFEVGLFTSHCFVMPLYFGDILTKALHLDTIQMILGVAVIMMAHRLVAGIPMMIVVPRLRKNLKGLFIGLVFFEGIAIAATPFIANPWAAISVWLMHDLLGAGIWLPIQINYIQKYARPERRGADVSKVLGLSQLGRVVGPLLATALLTVPIGYYEVGAPFVASGVIVALSSLILLKL